MIKIPAAVRGAMLALGLSMLGAMPASAQTLFSADEDSVAKVLKDAGLKADISYDDWSGAPIVTSYNNDVKAGFDIRFDSCDEDGAYCTVLFMSAGFFFDAKANTVAASYEKLNEWNTNNWGKAFVDEDGTMWIVVEMSINSATTEDNFRDTLQWFEDMMGHYTTFIGWQAN